MYMLPKCCLEKLLQFKQKHWHLSNIVRPFPIPWLSDRTSQAFQAREGTFTEPWSELALIVSSHQSHIIAFRRRGNVLREGEWLSEVTQPENEGSAWLFTFKLSDSNVHFLSKLPRFPPCNVYIHHWLCREQVLILFSKWNIQVS